MYWYIIKNSAESIYPLFYTNLVNSALLLPGNLLSGQNFLTPELFIIPIHGSVRKKYTAIHKRLIWNKFNHSIFLHFKSEKIKCANIISAVNIIS